MNCLDCGAVISESSLWSFCDTCYDKRRRKQYEERKQGYLAENWQRPLFSLRKNEYFGDADGVIDCCLESGCDVIDLRLVLCGPRFLKELSPFGCFMDELDELDVEVDEADAIPKEILEAFQALNAVIRKCKEEGKGYGSFPSEVRPSDRCIEKLQAMLMKARLKDSCSQ